MIYSFSSLTLYSCSSTGMTRRTEEGFAGLGVAYSCNKLLPCYPSCRPAGSSNCHSYSVLASGSWKLSSSVSAGLYKLGDITALNYSHIFEKRLPGFISSNFGHCGHLYSKIVILSIHCSQRWSSHQIRILLPKDKYSGPFEIQDICTGLEI